MCVCVYRFIDMSKEVMNMKEKFSANFELLKKKKKRKTIDK